MYSARDKELCLSVLDKAISVTTRINTEFQFLLMTLLYGMTLILIIVVTDIFITLIGNSISLSPLKNKFSR